MLFPKPIGESIFASSRLSGLPTTCFSLTSRCLLPWSPLIITGACSSVCHSCSYKDSSCITLKGPLFQGDINLVYYLVLLFPKEVLLWKSVVWCGTTMYSSCHRDTTRNGIWKPLAHNKVMKAENGNSDSIYTELSPTSQVLSEDC